MLWSYYLLLVKNNVFNFKSCFLSRGVLPPQTSRRGLRPLHPHQGCVLNPPPPERLRIYSISSLKPPNFMFSSNKIIYAPRGESAHANSREVCDQFVLVRPTSRSSAFALFRLSTRNVLLFSGIFVLIKLVGLTKELTGSG